MLLAPESLEVHRPFRIGDGPSRLGPRLGGRAPDLPKLGGLVPQTWQYVLTFPLSSAVGGDVYASIFVTSDRVTLIRTRNRGFHTDHRVIAVTHSEVGRSPGYRNLSPLSAHPLVILPESPDPVEDGEGGSVFASVHKFGGRPYCIQEPELPGAGSLFAEGYRQVLQLDVPGAEDGPVQGDWPFFGGLLNVFWREPWEPGELHWYLQG